VQVSAQVHDATARIIIHDNGPGIAPEILAKIFEYYYTTKDKGIGIGLPISYMVVKDHGGDIQVTSEQGKGTTFTVILPL
jgi:two-component system NtrC family sensor kinase